jgi:hypothetical protein
MAVCNRDLDASEQKHAMYASLVGTITGQTYALAVVPYNSQLLAVSQAVIGLSGAPNHSLWIQRFIAGSGVTSISIGNSLVATTWGTSGTQGFSIPGGATYPLFTGDLLVLSTAASNTATVNTTVTMVIQALQDVKTLLGQ